jgi:radical SAM superfamily enzyme YgiQ (UPF0313 family)
LTVPDHQSSMIHVLDIVIISTYELGRQPFGVASPAAWLKQAGASVTTVDLAIEKLSERLIAEADLICFYVPMHTASRIATAVARRVRTINPDAHLCFYGLYAPVNESFFRSLGAGTILGGEFEQGIVNLYRRLEADRPSIGPQVEPVVSIARQQFLVPDRSGLPTLGHYASLTAEDGSQRIVGYTEATRGCKHTCRHCPIVPVYGGRFRVVPRDIVIKDIRQQVAAGAQHITFGDPDFFNGPGHSLALVNQLHEEFPDVTYDVTIKVEHLIKNVRHLPTLKRTGCLFVTSAVESTDKRTLEYFDKRHTLEDFTLVVKVFREIDLHLSPTFVTFTPWTTLRNYLELLEEIHQLGLVPNVSPIQYAIRLLIPAGSQLLDLSVVQEIIEPFDDEALMYPWKHPDPRVDQLYEEVLTIVQGKSAEGSRWETFADVWQLASDAYGVHVVNELKNSLVNRAAARATVPHLNEPRYC